MTVGFELLKFGENGKGKEGDKHRYERRTMAMNGVRMRKPKWLPAPVRLKTPKETQKERKNKNDSPANSFASSVETALKCFKSDLFPTSMITMFESA